MTHRKLTEQICKDLERLRESRGLNRSQLSKKAGKWPSFVQAVLNGDCGHTTKTLLQFAEAMDADLIIEFRER